MTRMIVLVCCLGCLPVAGISGKAVAGTTAFADSSQITGNVDLAKAVALALTLNPELQSYSLGVRSADARRVQSGLRPNPELGLEIGEYNRGDQGFGSSELSLVLGQVFELGGKRHWRTQLASAQTSLADWDYQAKRLDVTAATAERFVTVLAAQRLLELDRSLVEVAEQTHRAVAERVSAGKEPPSQASLALAELELARIDLQAAQDELNRARLALAGMWGSDRAQFGQVTGMLETVPAEVPTFAELKGRLPSNPDLARWQAEQDLRQAGLEAARSARIPDLEASFGWHQFKEDGTRALSFGLGLPLPLFQRNQGNIAAARHDIQRARLDKENATLALTSQLAAAHAAFTTARQRALAYQTRVIPAMQSAFTAAETGYQQGKFSFLEMLDAQRGLFAAQGALVQAQTSCHLALIDLQRITCAPLDNEALTGKEN